MSSSVHYLCPHTTPISAIPPQFDQPAPSIVGIHYHPLSSLLFCEECDAVRCELCVSCELNCYYCPNCLFEVPAANIRSQKNRCARNCFLCPQCQHTLSAVATDPPSSSHGDDPKAPQASLGEAPFFLACTFCRWDSKQVGISFEKPTFLAQQLQQAESSHSEVLEFDKLKEHFEGYLKSQSQAQPLPASHHVHRLAGNMGSGSPAHLAASLALSKEVPTVSKYGTQLGLPSSVFKLRSNHSLFNNSTAALPANLNPDGTWKEDVPVYESLFPPGGAKKSSLKNDSDRLAFYRHGDIAETSTQETSSNLLIEQLTPIEKKWEEAWDHLDRVQDLKPSRVPLRSKRTKRCPTCQHILIKPEQKAQSIRFKIKLIASNYLPLIELQRKRIATSTKLGTDRLTSGISAAHKSAAAGRTGTTAGSNPLLGRVGDAPDEIIRPDRKYQFEMTFVNPLYEPINVRLTISPPAPVRSTVEGEPDQVPYNVQLLASEFTIAAFAEVWEYDEEDEAEGGANEENNEQKEADDSSGIKRNRLSTFGIPDSVRRRTLQTNVVTKKANRTTILVEAKTSKQFVGTLQADMLVTFTYQSDDLNDELDESPSRPPSGSHNPSSKRGGGDDREEGEGIEEGTDNQKMFTFWTKLTFGEVVPHPTLQTASQPPTASSSALSPNPINPSPLGTTTEPKRR
ncbi:hypothetical protein MJO28_001167 [Puccinia striiformis f. sp. tritici]|uniref:Uncharacterized protein n=1 Tax=Puccinia striiformis f. sp. tritici TaxID=168172 RepID=A0ACC0EZH0_9BASI|nr:hypothetical protein MJO28_001167 [Puccinia striiformis f. sp. tritici]